MFARGGRHWAVIAGAEFLVLTGVLAWVLWPAAVRAVPGTVQATVLSADEVGSALGVTLASTTSSSEPPPPLVADSDACTAAVGPATTTVYGRGWNRFYSVTHQDSEEVAEHVVTQVLGSYPEQGRAVAAFRELSEGVNGCDEAERTVVDDWSTDEITSNWFYDVYATTPDSLIWIAYQDGGDVWACYRQARLKGRTLLQVAVCEAGDGAPATAVVADRLASRVGV
ncbi:sensor domain-containing protein [Saccharopolyspora gregorii]|uniref:PknH-like extracellular domain-containing protein n=1 Tax=Saccharopolyspora gregorii TaxID=33914 RepID=A0ABP6RLP5_9PSEU